jgi:hypothetical protein
MSEPDPPALYRLGQYLRAALRHPDNRSAWIEWAADSDIYALWQELNIDIGTHGQRDS